MLTGIWSQSDSVRGGFKFLFAGSKFTGTYGDTVETVEGTPWTGSFDHDHGTTTGGTPKSVNGTYKGRWASADVTFVLVQKGGGVEGKWTYDEPEDGNTGGTLSGTLTGSFFVGSWTEPATKKVGNLYFNVNVNNKGKQLNLVGNSGDGDSCSDGDRIAMERK